MLLERRKARELKKKQINQGNNNEGDSKAEFTLDKMHAMEKMHMKDNENKVFSERDLFFKGNCTQSRHCKTFFYFEISSSVVKILLN